MTEKMYDLDSYIREFDAVVTACRINENVCELVLDRTAFFPEGGGQSSDIGEINGYPVTDVRIKGDEIIHYVSLSCNHKEDNNETTLPKAAVSDSAIISETALSYSSVAEGNKDNSECFVIGSTVHGRINWQKRFERMQQHSGEHLLSGFVFRHFGYHNTGFHLSDNGTTVDFDGIFTDDDLILIENTVNAIILKNVPSHVYFPDRDELNKLSYRSKKELEGPVRIVEFIGPKGEDPYDRCACCAPHVRSTIEIGLFKILSAEHFKGGTRMEIACGQRLLQEMRIMQDNIKNISRLLSVKPENTAQGVEKLNESFKALKFNAIKTERELLEMTAAHAEEPVLFLESADTSNVRLAVNSLTARFPKRYCAAFVGNDEKGYNFIVACIQNKESSELNCQELLTRMKSGLKASGGGSASMIQGNMKSTKEELLDSGLFGI